MSDKYLRSEKQNLLNAIGTEHCWGWSPAVDMLDILAAARNGNCNRPAEAQPVSEVPPAAQPAAPSKVDLDDLDALLASDPVAPAATATSTGPDDLHVLLLGCGDVRTVVQTVCKLRRHKPNGRVHLYLYEPNLRTHCRNLVLLQMLFDRLTMDELEDRTSMFLETFGNALIRDITAAHLKAATTRALKLLEKNDGYLAEFFNFDEMKMKERDFIEHQLRHWVSDTSRFDVAAQWDHRVRTEMAERYDNKTNIIDWDFHMNLMEYTHLIKFPEYREWRVSGQAFDYARINPRKQFKYDYTVPNKSLAHFDRLGRGVYNGDVKYGPFYALGCDTENSHLLHRGIEGTVKYGNGVIAMHNVRAWLYELATQKEWPWAEHKFAWDDPEQYNFLPEGTPKTEELSPLMPNVAIHCLGLELERFLLHLKEFTSPQVKLDAAFVSCGCSNFLDAPLFEAMRDDGVIVCETIKFVLDAVDESKDAFIQKLNGQAGASGWSHQPSLTARLHKRQPAAKEHTTEPSATQIRADQRFMKPMQVVYVKR